VGKGTNRIPENERAIRLSHTEPIVFTSVRAYEFISSAVTGFIVLNRTGRKLKENYFKLVVCLFFIL
jgi:hypothetical protein